MYTLGLGLVTGGVGLGLLKRFINGGVNPHQVSLDGKTVVVTGGNTGIGIETVKSLALMGAHVVLACRDPVKANEAMKELQRTANGKLKLEFIQLELDDKRSIENFSKEFHQRHKQLNILINNAGIMACPPWKTKDGFEMQFGVNHLGHFLLTSLLMDSLKAGAPSRVVNVSSRAHIRGTIDFSDLNWTKRRYNTYSAYSQSKLANVLFTRELNRRYEKDGVTSYSLHPGVISTELTRHMITGWKEVIAYIVYPAIWYFMKSPWYGAQTSIYCAVAPGLEKQAGKYFSDCALKTPIKEAEDDAVAKKLWDVSEEFFQITFGEKN
jgi:retinol dehydrogenase-13